MDISRLPKHYYPKAFISLSQRRHSYTQVFIAMSQGRHFYPKAFIALSQERRFYTRAFISLSQGRHLYIDVHLNVTGNTFLPIDVHNFPKSLQDQTPWQDSWKLQKGWPVYEREQLNFTSFYQYNMHQL